jgi:iron complex outermembrane receptor protein
MRPSTKLSLRFAAIALAAWVAAMDAASAQDGARKYQIEEQSLGQALREFALASDLDLLFSPDLVAGKKSPSLDGKFTVNEGLRTLLRGSGLEFSVSGSRVVISEAQEAHPRQETSTSSSVGSVAGYTRLAQAEGVASPASSTKSGSGSQQHIEVEEVVVTAQKRVERLQDVPVPVSALSTKALADTGELRLQDYFTRLPGLTVTSSNYGPPMVAIRGITSGGLGVNATVALMVDDVPLGPSMREAFGPEVPEIDPSDLERIEVLRGPQGTLYGASSMGGLIKYVTAEPSLGRMTAELQSSVSSIEDSDRLGYSARGAINVPLGSTFAVRASASTRREEGYIDDPVHGRSDVNGGEYSGGLLSALWRPSDDLSVRFAALLQDARRYGSSEVNIGLGDLEQNKIPSSGGNTKRLEFYSGTVSARVGSVEVTSVTGYNRTERDTSADNSTSTFFGPRTVALFGVSGFEFRNHVETSRFSQEIRANASFGSRWDWLLGAFYSREKNDLVQNWLARDFTTGSIAGQWYYTENDFDFDERAAFANLTYHVTDSFDVQFGARQSESRKSLSTPVRSGPYMERFLGGITSVPRTDSKETSFTYLVTPSIKLSPDVLVYARLASGYRPGGPNVNCGTLNQPCEYDPDRTISYEAGLKGSILGRALSFDASVYRIDWKDIQVLVLDPAVSASIFTDNGNSAKSEGIELSVESRPWPGGTVFGWISYGDAVLTEAFPPPAARLSYGVSGTRLPFSSRESGSLSIQQELPFVGRKAFVAATVSYVGDRFSAFAASATAPRERFPAYAKIDLSTGFRTDSWTVNAYLNNVGDKRGVLFGGLGTFDATGFNLIQPRTLGLSVTRTFE